MSVSINPYSEQIESFQALLNFEDCPQNADIFSQLYRRRDAYDRVLAQFHIDGFGLTLSNDNESQWTVILADMSEPGRYRHQIFTESGFLSHATFDSIEEVIEDVIDGGFYHFAAGMLETLCTSQDWAEGMRTTHLLADLNRGNLSHSDFIEMLKREPVAA